MGAYDIQGSLLILIVRIQALWFLFDALLDATYLPRYFPSASMGGSFAMMSHRSEAGFIYDDSAALAECRAVQE